MKQGTLYGIGIGPGDPELITLKGARLISACRNLFVPKARTASESVALAIARPLVGPEARIEEMVFPMTADREELAEKWDAAAGRIAGVLTTGDDACFLTLGDPLLYSTYIYLLRALRKRLPDLKAVIVPGIMAFGAAAPWQSSSPSARRLAAACGSPPTAVPGRPWDRPGSARAVPSQAFSPMDRVPPAVAVRRDVGEPEVAGQHCLDEQGGGSCQ